MFRLNNCIQEAGLEPVGKDIRLQTSETNRDVAPDHLPSDGLTELNPGKISWIRLEPSNKRQQQPREMKRVEATTT